MKDPRHAHKEGSGSGMAVLIGFLLLAMVALEYLVPSEPPAAQQQAAQSEQTEVSAGGMAIPGAPEKLASTGAVLASPTSQELSVERIPFSNGLVQGTIALTGARVDELELSGVDTQLHDGKNVVFFAPSGDKIHFFDAGFQSTSAISIPNGQTVWKADRKELTPPTPLTLTWENGSGQTFKRTLSLKEGSYTIDVTDEVLNTSRDAIALSHYAQIHKSLSEIKKAGFVFNPEVSTFFNFIGPLAFFDGKRLEADYKDLKEQTEKIEGTKGWLGMTSRYFFAAIVPDQETSQKVTLKHSSIAGRDFYTVLAQSALPVLPGGGVLSHNYRLYAGPKDMEILKEVGSSMEEAVDYGWFHGIAALLYKVIMWFNGFTGNLGWAIIFTTLLLKLILFPLANKSYRSMAHMKKLQPRMKQLQEMYSGQREKLAMEMMALYKEHKVSPASGCWPMLIQIPIFFAFYKVILISYPFRHAEWMGWVHDLSAMDPYFILPLVMGVSMYFMQKLNPPAADPIQQKVMMILPWLFTAMCALFPAGLVLYWVTNNILSIAQQYYINKQLGVETK